ncbi:MAG TPA: alpha/beta fold hydrolase [Candidatus Limnocylindrales bacterium]
MRPRPSTPRASSALARGALVAVAVAVLAACGSGSSGGGFTYPPVSVASGSAPSSSSSNAPSSPAASSPAGSSSNAASPAGSSPASASPDSSSSVALGPTGPGASAKPSASPFSSPSSAPPAGALPQSPKVVKVETCPGSSFTCVTLGVPRDHFSAGGPTWNVTFAIKKAAKQRKGVFVTITGGPGSSGLASAEDYTSAFATSVTDHYDIVFLDQRGVGLSQPLACPVATASYYQTDSDPTKAAQFDAAAHDAKAYVDACLAETKVDPTDLPFYSTRQAVEDLEAFRLYLGVDKIALYGESYGTQYAQTYASAHPTHVASLFVDGPVDLTMDGPAFYREEVRAFDDALTATLAACDTNRVCRRDSASGAVVGYDALRTKLLAGPVSIRFPTARGTFATRALTSALLDNAAAGYVYSQLSRMLLQRAVTAATQGDYVPLIRLAYDSLTIDPETLAPIADPTYSDAMYYAVECQDYAYYPTAGDPTARLHAWVADAKLAGVGSLRLSSTYFGDTPCLWWPNTPTTDPRIPALVDEPFPTFVLTATLDPATPFADAMRIYSRLTDAYMFVQTGGPHVIFGRGLSCPDDAISAYLATDTLPTTRITVCAGAVADPYVADPLRVAAGYSTARQFGTSIEDTLLNTDDYNYRYGSDPLALGCDQGGALTYRPGSAGTRVDLAACAFTPGLAMTGSASLGDDGSFRLSVRIGGQALLYARDADGNVSVSGTFRGKPAR